ncbi:hypothetical protein ACFPER_16535 [Agromyces aurantiacus]|uniref:DUF1345 domain-containing protein n=1 Tax=Agromyces aurantiacus TaxID=165814 RepID=A0ABV9RDJ1_9MICO|nr:hypothetical protein [Agromyces aurantiacus]MBM7504701.1 branched-subunit amino acid transport protein [Agromyces aurantiacus]
MAVVQQHPSRTTVSEHRWPVVAALLLALGLYAALPNEFIGAQRFVVVGTGLALLIPLVIENPHRLTRQSAWSRRLAIALAVLLVVANQLTLVTLVVSLLTVAKDAPGLLQAALQVWVANVIGFATLYWELDRGGPVRRTMDARATLPPADFRFPQDEDADAAPEVAARSAARQDWTPRFADYLYTSLSNSMAFSATDAMPLSWRVKLLMGLQAFGGFLILALVIARSVNILA